MAPWRSLIFFVALLFLALAPLHAATTPASRPNFVLFLAEAQGWSSMSSPMDDHVPASHSALNLTVHLDQLAKAGMRFSWAYAASPRCTPSRAALMTGRSPAALHMTFVHAEQRNGGNGSDASRRVIEPRAVTELPASELTIAELLHRSGYATALYGKWHLGRASPNEHGFDDSDGPTSNEGLTDNPGETDRMTDRGIAFITRQRAAGKPFFLELAYYPARNPADVLAATMAAVKQRLGDKLNRGRGGPDRMAVEVAANQNMDESIGRVMQKLDDLGVAGNTYVIYTADHGSQGRNSNTPLSAGKGTIWEGGIRVPLLVRGPGIAVGSSSHTQVTAVDLFPTVAELAHVAAPLPRGLEGGSLVPILTHAGTGAVRRSREGLFFHFPHYDMDDSGPASAIILGDYKLIHFYSGNALRLYDLKKDMEERNDLSAAMPAKVTELNAALSAHLKDVGADLPVPNPHFDPNAPPELLKPRKGQ